jgi:hypothetical protein
MPIDLPAEKAAPPGGGYHAIVRKVAVRLSVAIEIRAGA